MRVIVALGGNALLQRKQVLNAKNQRENIRIAAEQLAEVHNKHQLIISHGNGPQVGLLALMDNAYSAIEPYPLDILNAETVGMIGYMIEQELGNKIPERSAIITVLTQILVDPNDQAFTNPTKFIGPVYERSEAEKLKKEKNWSIGADGDKFRRVVPSPLPKKIIEIDVIKMLVDSGVIVICTGGGGIPTAYDNNNQLYGVEAIIDKDFASGLLAKDLNADMLVMLTDVPNVYSDFSTPQQKAIKSAPPCALETLYFAQGSMGPKVSAACKFVKETGLPSAIGQLNELTKILEGTAGTRISNESKEIKYWD